MRLQRLHLDGFGRWMNATFDFAPGLNVFVGVNEAGKSTLQQSILAMLYGFSPGQRANDHGLLEYYRPWYYPGYGGMLDYQLDGGHAFRIIRSFADAEMSTSLIDLATGADLSTVFTGERSGRVDIATKHLGVPHEVFMRTQFIRQNDLGPLNDAAYEITEQIANAMDPERRNRLVAHAQEILQRALAEQVGTQRASDTPLALVDERLQELQVEKKMIQLLYRRLLDDMMAQTEHQQALATATHERDQLKYALMLARLNALAYRIHEVEQLTGAESSLHEQFEALQPFADFPLKTRESVMRHAQERQQHLERLARAEGAAQPARAQADELQLEVAKLREHVRALESARDIPLAHEPHARELERTLPEAILSFQRTDEQLNGIKQAIAALEPTRLLAERRKEWLGDLDQVHDLRLQWDVGNQQIADAEHALAESDERWQLMHLSADEYAQLTRRARDLTPAFVDKVRRHQATAEHMQTSILCSRKRRALRTFAFAAGLSTLLGFTLLVGTLLDEKTYWAVEGTAFLIGALPMGVSALVLWWLVRRERGLIAREQAEVAQALESLGFSSIAELDTTYMQYQQARPAYENWQRALATLEKLTQQREAIRGQLVTLLQAPTPDGITAERMKEIEGENKRIVKDMDELARLEQQREQIEREWHVLHETMQQIVQQTRAILKASGMIELNLLADLRSYLALCQNRRELDQVEAQLHAQAAVLSTKLDATLALESEVRTERSTLIGIDDELGLVLQRIGIQTDDLNEALKDYDYRYEQAERYLRVKAIRQSLERERKALLRSQSLDELKQQLNGYAATLHAMVERKPELAAYQSDQSEEALQSALGEAQGRVDNLHSNLTAIERRLEQGTKDYRSLAEVQEDIVCAQERIRHLSIAGRGLQIACEQLSAAADDYHRNFLPRLNQMLTSDLEASTGGQYSHVQVDRANFRVRVGVPTLPGLIATEQLSQGVQDQIYLLLRFGLAELISDGRESLPFLLDDPFVNYDHVRLLLTLNLIARVAERTQLFLFTKDDFIARWFGEQSFDAARHQLNVLT